MYSGFQKIFPSLWSTININQTVNIRKQKTQILQFCYDCNESRIVSACLFILHRVESSKFRMCSLLPTNFISKSEKSEKYQSFLVNLFIKANSLTFGSSLPFRFWLIVYTAYAAHQRFIFSRNRINEQLFLVVNNKTTRFQGVNEPSFSILSKQYYPCAFNESKLQ